MSHVGRHIGRYRILEQLGQGGMSVVYKGLDTALDREVAVKVLHPHLAGKEESRKRLAREAQGGRAAAPPEHPRGVRLRRGRRVTTRTSSPSTSAGKTLRQFLADEPLEPPEIAAMVVHEIAAALAHAHESGVIHRDFKPENVMVREDGVLKLMDFGIAKILDRDEKMTMTGALVGSPAHMAPEIIEGEEAGAEADVFSLGTMLYLVRDRPAALHRRRTPPPRCKQDPRRHLRRPAADGADGLRRARRDHRDLPGAPADSALPQRRRSCATRWRTYLAGLGLTRVGEELPLFFADPGVPQRADAAADRRAAQAQRARSSPRSGRRARSSSLNQVLAHDPSNTRTLELLARLKASRRGSSGFGRRCARRCRSARCSSSA